MLTTELKQQYNCLNENISSHQVCKNPSDLITYFFGKSLNIKQKSTFLGQHFVNTNSAILYQEKMLIE